MLYLPTFLILDMMALFASGLVAAVMRSDGFERMKEKGPWLQSEILKTIAGGEGEGSSAVEKSQSVWGQLSDGGDMNGRRVRQRI